MTSYAIRNQPATALYRLAVALQTAALRLRGAARRLDARLERRRLAAAAIRDLSAMGDRELADIGLTRADIGGVAWGRSPRAADALWNAAMFGVYSKL